MGGLMTCLTMFFTIFYIVAQRPESIIAAGLFAIARAIVYMIADDVDDVDEER